MRLFHQSWKILKENALLVLLCSLIDFLFLFAYGFLTSPIRQKMGLQMLELGKVLAAQGMPALSGLFTAQASVFLEKLAFSLIIFAVLTYVLYCVFQGVNWKLALDMTGKKQEWLSYLNSFAKVNALWFSLFVLAFALNVFAAMRRTVLQAMNTPGGNVLGWVSLVAVFLIGVCAVLSYPSTSVKQGWRLAQQFKKVLPVIAAIAVYFAALNYVLILLAGVNTDLMYVVGIILLFPAVTWSRVLISLRVR